MPPLIQVVDHDSDIVHRSRQRQSSVDRHDHLVNSKHRVPRKIRESSRILLLQDLAEGVDQSFGARELLDYARQLRILKDPLLGHYFVNLPWTVSSAPLSRLKLSTDLHVDHSGDFDWVGRDFSATPKYLWDSQDGCTVQTTKAMLEQGYIAVSWTWGRYQRQSQGRPLERRSRGVGAFGRRWKVPQLPLGSSGKDVLSDLKVCLKSMETCRYFWVDLLCIDQHKSYEKRQEIAKQASIFGGAKATICYLWHQEGPEDLTEALTGLGRLLNWALIFGDSKALRQDGRPPLEQEFPVGSARHAESTYHARFGHLKDDHWFTSLWALQEIVLAPAGVWMTRFGHVCRVNGQLLTTRLMAIIIRLLSWAAHAREDLWEESRNQSSLSPKDWELLQTLQKAEDDSIRHELGKAFEDLSRTWQCVAREQVQSWLGVPLWYPRRPRSAPPLFRRLPSATAEDGFQGIVVQTADAEKDDGHWLFSRYKREQGLRDEIRKWTTWSFGHSCIDVALPTTRAAIIVAGAKRSIMESHDQSREIALLAALKIQPPDWFREGHEPPAKVVALRSNHHLSVLLMNTILAEERARGQGARLFDVTHNLPRRTADTSIDMNDFDETEWDQTEFEVDYIIEKQVMEGTDNMYRAISSIQTDRPVRRIPYDFHGHTRYAEVLPGGTSNLTDMLPDTASMLNQHILHFVSESSIQWRSTEGWHMHKGGILHLPQGTCIQQMASTRRCDRRDNFMMRLRLNGSSEADYEIRSREDLEVLGATQPWLHDALGRVPHFRFLPLGQYPRNRSSRSPSPHMRGRDQSLDEQEVVGVVLVASATRLTLRDTSDQNFPAADEQTAPSAHIWHKLGSYRATGLQSQLSQDPDGFFVVSYTDRDIVKRYSRLECEQLLNDVLHAPAPRSDEGDQ